MTQIASVLSHSVVRAWGLTEFGHLVCRENIAPHTQFHQNCKLPSLSDRVIAGGHGGMRSGRRSVGPVQIMKIQHGTDCSEIELQVSAEARKKHQNCTQTPANPHTAKPFTAEPHLAMPQAA